MTTFKWEDLIGIPFVEGGRSLSGVDCVGLVYLCYRRQGKEVSDFTDYRRIWQHRALYKMGNAPDQFSRIDTPSVGSIVAFAVHNRERAIDHIGILVSPHHFIHALESVGVSRGDLSRAPWNSYVVGYYDYII